MQDLHSVGEKMEKRIVRKFHLLHIKHADDVQLHDLKMPFNVDTMLCQNRQQTDGLGDATSWHPMPARESPKCAGQESQAPRWGEEWEAVLRPQMAKIMHARAALQKECPNQTSMTGMSQ